MLALADAVIIAFLSRTDDRALCRNDLFRDHVSKRFSLRAMKYIRDNRAETTKLIAREFSMDQEIAGLAYGQLLELLSPDGRNRVSGYQLLVDFARTAQKIDRPITPHSSSMKRC